MKFSPETKIAVDSVADDIPVIHGKNYYIDQDSYVATINKSPVDVYDSLGNLIDVVTIKPVTEFIYIINNKLAYRTSEGFLVTEIPAPHEKYIGGFQGIAGFDVGGIQYSFMNSNNSEKSTVILTGRINNSKQLEIKLGDTWVVPLGEFRCFISNTFYNIGYDTLLPNSFGDTFTVTLQAFKNITISPDTNYIRDIFIAGNTLYLSTRLKVIGSTPYDWTSISTDTETVIWSEDARLSNVNFIGNPSASNFYAINYNSSNIYWVSGKDFSILQEYQHKLPILGVGSIDKFGLAIVDKEACSIITSYVSLNTWLIKSKTYFPFNQLSAYEDITTNYLREEVNYVTDLDMLAIKSTQRANMMLHILNNKVLSGCHTDSDISAGEFSCYTIIDSKLYKLTKVEDSGDYDELDLQSGVINYDSYIYIGSDLEPDMGGSTLADTEIMFEGKIALSDNDDICVESSGDKPLSKDLPVRTNQENPENKWYLYSKVLRYPVSYTDWVKISMMPTTKIFKINLQSSTTTIDKSKVKKKG